MIYIRIKNPSIWSLSTLQFWTKLFDVNCAMLHGGWVLASLGPYVQSGQMKKHGRAHGGHSRTGATPFVDRNDSF